MWPGAAIARVGLCCLGCVHDLAHGGEAGRWRVDWSRKRELLMSSCRRTPIASTVMEMKGNDSAGVEVGVVGVYKVIDQWRERHFFFSFLTHCCCVVIDEQPMKKRLLHLSLSS